MGDVHYLNVDLEIDSRVDLTPIVEAFGDDAFVMYNGEWGKFFRASFEVVNGAGANEDIGYFCTLIEALDGEAKELWDNSFSKVFDLGFESGDTTQNCRTVLDPSVVARLGAIGATLAVTIYPVDPK